MNEQAFQILEFDKLRELVRRGAQTPMGRDRVESLSPIAELAELTRQLAAASECAYARKRGVKWAFDELNDPSEAIARLRVAGTALDPVTILGLSRLCNQTLTARSSIMAEREACPVLSELVAGLPRELNSLVARIANKILPSWRT